MRPELTQLLTEGYCLVVYKAVCPHTFLVSRNPKLFGVIEHLLIIALEDFSSLSIKLLCHLVKPLSP